MRAVVVREWMEPADLSVSTLPCPALEPGRVAIDVEAAGCNFFDTLIVRGAYQVKPPFPFSPGGEVAGVVAGVAEGVSGFHVGQRVMAYVGFGGFAERVNASPDTVIAIPETMSFREAAAFPIVYGTAWVSAVERGGLRAGETLLVTAAAGGVGLAAVQVGRALGARVIALAGGADKLAAAERAGADLTLDYREPDWSERVVAETDGRGADVIVESVGGEIFEGCTRCIAWGGRLVVVGFSSREIPTIRANRVMLKHIALVGVHFGPMWEREPETLKGGFEALFDLYEGGRLAPIVSGSVPLEKLPEALAAIEGRKTIGKLVVDVRAPREGA